MLAVSACHKTSNYKKSTASNLLQFWQMIENTSLYLKLLKCENVKNGPIGPFSFVPTILKPQQVVASALSRDCDLKVGIGELGGGW